MTGGGFTITSLVGVGTNVTADFVYDNIDRMPLGDIPFTISTLFGSKAGIDWNYEHKYNENIFTISSRDIVRQIGEIDFSQPEIVEWIAQYIGEQLQILYGC